MCSPACAAGHSRDSAIVQPSFEWNPPVISGVTTVTIEGLTTYPPSVCSGTGWIPAGVQGNAHWSAGSYRCGICGQLVEVDAYGKLTLHPYVKVP